MKSIDYDKKIAELYDEIVNSGYHNQGKYVGELLNIIPKGSTVLELGCGTGNITLPLNNSGIRCEGVDKSVHMLYRLKQKDPTIATHLDSIENFRFGKEYDYALSCSGPFSIKGNELESYLLSREDVIKCLRKYGRTKKGLLINKGKDKELLEIPLNSRRIFRNRELREKDYMLMYHLIYENGQLTETISNVKRRYPFEIFSGLKIKDFDNFILVKSEE